MSKRNFCISRTRDWIVSLYKFQKFFAPSTPRAFSRSELPLPPVLILNSSIENPESQTDVLEYLEKLGIGSCTNYNCLTNNLNNEYKSLFDKDVIYFPRYSQYASILWATISPNVYFQATEYMYDSTLVDSIYFHGHPSIGTNMLNIINDVCLMGESIFADFYDGYGNGEYDEGEFFIDTADGIGDIDTYYYEISTFSESYKNYYFYPQLLPNDPERSNLRDENMNPVMGAFGSITTNKINFKIIDCLEFLLDEESCTNEEKTHGVCEWYPNVVIDDYTGPACLPINWDF